MLSPSGQGLMYLFNYFGHPEESVCVYARMPVCVCKYVYSFIHSCVGTRTREAQARVLGS